jgi:hypothetical protein
MDGHTKLRKDLQEEIFSFKDINEFALSNACIRHTVKDLNLAMKSQSSFLYVPDQELLLFENGVQEELDYLTDKYEIPKVKLVQDHIHKSHRPPVPHTDLLSQAAIDRIHALYLEDFELWDRVRKERTDADSSDNG